LQKVFVKRALSKYPPTQLWLCEAPQTINPLPYTGLTVRRHDYAGKPHQMAPPCCCGRIWTDNIMVHCMETSYEIVNLTEPIRGRIKFN